MASNVAPLWNVTPLRTLKSQTVGLTWDHRSAILMLRDGGTWHSFRLPKASHTYDGAHGWNQILVGGAFEQVGARTRRQGAHDIGLVAVDAENDHTRRSIEFLRPRRDFNAGEFRHADVQDHQIRMVLLREPDRLQAVGGLGDHGNAGRFEQSA